MRSGDGSVTYEPMASTNSISRDWTPENLFVMTTLKTHGKAINLLACLAPCRCLLFLGDCTRPRSRMPRSCEKEETRLAVNKNVCSRWFSEIGCRTAGVSFFSNVILCVVWGPRPRSAHTCTPAIRVTGPASPAVRRRQTACASNPA